MGAQNRWSPDDYWEERLGQDFSLRGTGRIELGRAYNGWLYRVQRHVFLRHVRRIGRDRAAAGVLDVGSGTGFYVERWHELRVRRVVGSDLTRVAVQRLRERWPDGEFLQLNIAGDPADPPCGGYDWVSAMAVLYHIVDDDLYARALSNVHALLKPGGHFVFSENFLHGDAIRGTHAVHRPLGQIESCLRRAGFEIVLRKPLFFLMNAPNDAPRKRSRLLWNMIFAGASKGPVAGWLLGAGLYLPELLCTAIARESHGTEIMICRKQEAAQPAGPDRPGGKGRPPR